MLRISVIVIKELTAMFVFSPQIVDMPIQKGFLDFLPSEMVSNSFFFSSEPGQYPTYPGPEKYQWDRASVAKDLVSRNKE